MCVCVFNIFRARGKEREIETLMRDNINWLPPARTSWEIKPKTRSCALTRNQTANHSWCVSPPAITEPHRLGLLLCFRSKFYSVPLEKLGKFEFKKQVLKDTNQVHSYISCQYWYLLILRHLFFFFTFYLWGMKSGLPAVNWFHWLMCNLLITNN